MSLESFMRQGGAEADEFAASQRRMELSLSSLNTSMQAMQEDVSQLRYFLEDVQTSGALALNLVHADSREAADALGCPDSPIERSASKASKASKASAMMHPKESNEVPEVTLHNPAGTSVSMGMQPLTSRLALGPVHLAPDVSLSRRGSQNSRNAFSPRQGNERRASLHRLNSSAMLGDLESLPPTLPRDWPEYLEVRKGYALIDAAATRSHPGSPTEIPHEESRRTNNLERWLEDMGDEKDAPTHRSCCAIDPSSKVHMTWDALSLVVLAFDLTVTPAVLAWDAEFEGWLKWVAWLSVAFWTLDLCLGFVTGYHGKGIRPVMSLAKIARRYLRTWFGLDLLVVVVDWSSMLLLLVVESTTDGSTGSLRMLRFAKLGRMLRMLSMLRMFRFVRIIDEFVERNLHETGRLVLQVFRILCGLMWVNHLLSCMWYSIGRYTSSDTGLRWVSFEVTTNDGRSVEYLETNGVFQYMTAFHWTVAHITLGATDISSVTSVEKAFSVLCLLLGLIFGTCLISTLSASMVDYAMRQKDQNEKLRTLRRFLRENIRHHPVLALLVQQQVLQHMEENKRVTEKDVPALKLIAKKLRLQLRFEIYKPHLLTHSLFWLWQHYDLWALQHLCQYVDVQIVKEKDDLFLAGSNGDTVYLLSRGAISYLQEPASSVVNDTIEENVEIGSWIVEAALWCSWIHVGTASARKPCEILTLHAESMSTLLGMMHTVMKDIVMEYCYAFQRRLQTSKPPYAPWPNDLHVPFATFGEIAIAMKASLRNTICKDLLDKFYSGKVLTQKPPMAMLQEEVSRGLSSLILSESGGVQRVTSLVAARVEHEAGHTKKFLVQIAQWGGAPGTEMKPLCQLPQLRYKEDDELVSNALWRLMETEFPMLKDAVSVRRWKRQAVEKESNSYKIHTHSLRSTCTLEYTGGTEISSQHVIAHTGHLASTYSRGHSDESCSTWASSNSRHTRGAHLNSFDMKHTVSERFQIGAASSAASFSMAISVVQKNLGPGKTKDASQEQATMSLLEYIRLCPVYILDDEESGQKKLYAWMSDEHYNRLKSQQLLLQKWTRALEVSLLMQGEVGSPKSSFNRSPAWDGSPRQSGSVISSVASVEEQGRRSQQQPTSEDFVEFCVRATSTETPRIIMTSSEGMEAATASESATKAVEASPPPQAPAVFSNGSWEIDVDTLEEVPTSPGLAGMTGSESIVAVV